MVRFIHTADWQLGLRVNYIPGDTGAVVRDARLRTVRAIGQLARAQAVDFVVVAGDVFEHHGLRTGTLRQTFAALAAYPCPVFLLPGNHDPHTPDGLYLSGVWLAEAPANVHVLGDATPVLVGDETVLLPCPLLERHTFQDPTAHLSPELGPRDRVRVGVAHGGILEILQGMTHAEEAPPNAITRDAAANGALDYLALGDWHGTLRVDAHTWYSGAPEATRFKEADPGNVLVVEVDGPGAAPRVVRHEVATLRWVQHDAVVRSAADLALLQAWFEGLEAREDTLVEVFLEGTLDAQDDVALRALLARQADLLRWLRVREEKYSVLLSEADLARMTTGGWIGDVVKTLRAEQAPEAAHALRLLYQLHQEVVS